MFAPILSLDLVRKAGRGVEALQPLVLRLELFEPFGLTDLRTNVPALPSAAALCSNTGFLQKPAVDTP
ncbi:MAG: hypothetical protein CMM07_01115 [Rhodopirellula sp.]|nr:hypothetical protein [Rhodopirellula sp.]